MFWLWVAAGLIVWMAIVVLIGKWIGQGMGSRQRKRAPSTARDADEPGPEKR